MEIPNIGQSNFDGRKTLYVLLKFQITYSKQLDFAKEIYIAIECFQKQFPPNSVGGKYCVSFAFTRGLRTEIKLPRTLYSHYIFIFEFM